MKTLTIISHTEHYQNPDGTIVGLGSTVTEINHLLEVFDEIIHVAMLHNEAAPSSCLPYLSNKVTFVAIPALGGKNLSDKLSILSKIPSVLKTVKSEISKTDYFQFRAPTGIGVFVIPYLVLFSSKKGWFKYAGNWKQKQAPLAYRFQRWILQKQSRKVTINGIWENQPNHCLTFENPCLNINEVEKGNRLVKVKAFDNKLVNFCFVGRLEEEKGIGLLINAFTNLNEDDRSRIGNIHIVGDGRDMDTYKNYAKASKLNFIFYGFLSRSDVHDIYIKSHAIILPSASEGFPKVIAEALNFGCLPVVSNVSGVSNYIHEGLNGYLLEAISVEEIIAKIKRILCLSEKDYLEMLNFERETLEKFTFNYYNSRVNNELVL